MSWLWTLPLAAQGLLLGADELWFHRRRGLPRWERLGHPIDCLSVLACSAWTWIAPPGARAPWVYLALAALSCALVTKDEVVHSSRCTPAEHWIHAALFVLHPLVLGVIALLWVARERAPLAEALAQWSGVALPAPALAGAILTAQAALVGAYTLYIALYWNTRPS